ncbi:hypothetical protein L6452_01186 [Arctium lappa]|uniref:Uncharacterized protein n=1 Tax=Arctium lappa TaxID=4217 RepID=A0ACB9FGV3_ARCLA|nr:hypothetical protein L6452_01186 [Arctium lappa]
MNIFRSFSVFCKAANFQVVAHAYLSKLLSLGHQNEGGAHLPLMQTNTFVELQGALNRSTSRAYPYDSEAFFSAITFWLPLLVSLLLLVSGSLCCLSAPSLASSPMLFLSSIVAGADSFFPSYPAEISFNSEIRKKQ